jgi:hypothetical protein
MTTWGELNPQDPMTHQAFTTPTLEWNALKLAPKNGGNTANEGLQESTA